MIQCPNCGGNLKFDIPSQMLKCDYCQTVADPYSIVEQTDAVESQMFETTEYTCPQCGGKIFANETSAAEFCLYCGGSTILSGQLKQEKRPDYVIPFTKTKEDCKKAYKKLMRKALFAPSELKKPENLERFCGIYMPYWSYHVKQSGKVLMKGKTVTTSGKYEITKRYNLSCDLEGDYRGLSHDASSVFDDTITECLAPYNVVNMKKFTPAFLSGFYADIADVESKLYQDWAMNMANECTYSKVTKAPVFRKYTITKPSSNAAMTKLLNSQQMEPDSTMYPVWFLTYRKNDRLLYATVNGQTGKVVADIPIEYRRYIIGSLLLAIPVFLLLNIFFTIRPIVTLRIASVLTMIAMLALGKFKKKLDEREKHKQDPGYRQGRSWQMQKEAAKKRRIEDKEAKRVKKREQKRRPEEIKSNAEASGRTPANVSKESNKKKSAKSKTASFIVMGAILVGTIIGIIAIGGNPKLILYAIPVASGIVNFILLYQNWMNLRESLPFLLAVISSSITAMILFLRPVADLWYYLGTIVSFGVILYGNLAIIGKYNKLSTRSIPSLHARGGMNHEQ